MKIYKYNSGKDSGDSSGRTDGGYSGGATVLTSDTAEKAKRLSETHLIFGQPFDGTQNVAGDINNA